MGANEEFVHVEQLQQQQLKTAADMAYGNPSRFHLVSVINPQTGKLFIAAAVYIYCYYLNKTTVTCCFQNLQGS